MMMAYARAYPDLWTGPVMDLPDEARVLAAYLGACPGSSPFGLYHKALGVIGHELRRKPEQIRKALEPLTRIDFCRYDFSTEWVWVVEMAERQFRPLPLKSNNLVIRSARRWYINLPDNAFLGSWFDHYHDAFSLDNPDAFGGSVVERRGTAAPTIPVVKNDPPVQELTLLPPADTTIVVIDKVCGEIEFATWWKAYPRHEARVEALKVWKRKRIPTGTLPTMLAKLDAQRGSSKWQEGFIPHASTYLNQERWNDDIQKAGNTLTRGNANTVRNLSELSGEMNPFDGDES